MDDQIQSICDMFERKFSFNDVKKILETNDGHVSVTIDALMAIAVDTEINSSQNNFCPIAALKTSRTPKKKNNARSAMRTDREAFQQYCDDFENLLPTDHLNDIWQTVGREYWSDKIDLKKKYQLAKEYAEQRIQAMVDSPNSFLHSLTVQPVTEVNVSNDELDFQQFAQLFQGVITFSNLQIIWRNIQSSSKTEKQSMGVLYTMELLESDQTTNIASFPKSEQLLQEFIHDQEQSRIGCQASKGSMKVTIKHGKSSQNPALRSPQEMVKQMVQELFADNPLVTNALIDNMLIQYHYDLDRITEELCQSLLKKGSYIRENRSFASVVGEGSLVEESTGSGKSTMSSLGSNYESEKSPPSTIFTVVASRPKSTSPKPSSSAQRQQQMNQLRFGEYFLAVFQRNNPLLQASFHPHTGELCYEGSSHFQSVTQYYTHTTSSSSSSSAPSMSRKQQDVAMNMLTIAMDFHNLPVLQTLQLVASSIDYYRIHQRLHILGNTHIKRILLKFVVGRGMHSPGGIAKLGPAIQKLLRQREEKNVLAYDGEILVALNLRG